jgi:orotate phosphoribosyltransferase
MLYGPAYKGIPLVSAVAIAYARLTGNDISYAFNRKEPKDHGEGGLIVGTALAGKVLIVDDVISAGTSVRESVDIINRAAASPAAVLIALDRQEKGSNDVSAVQEARDQFAMPVIAIITLADIVGYLSATSDENLQTIKVYQHLYGV